MSSPEQNNKKRLVTGVAIFALLIGANLVVHLTRARKKPVVMPVQSTGGTPVTAIPGPVTAAALPVNIAASPDLGLDTRIAELNKKVEEYRLKLSEIPEPFKQPDLAAPMNITGTDCFVWQADAGQVIIIASEPSIVTPVHRTLKIVGDFTVKGRHKLLVRENDKIFLLDANEAYGKNQLAVVAYENALLEIRDSSGQTHKLPPPLPKNDDLNEIVDYLKGIKKEQTSFDVISETTNASESAKP